MKEIGYVIFGVNAILLICLLTNGFVQLYLLIQSKRKKTHKKKPLKNPLPFVSIQAPVYNERYVVEGLLDSLSKLDYPKDKFEILVLDDSTDETSSIIAEKAAQLNQQQYRVRVIKRETRNGYKAGALQESLSMCKGNFIAVFDADFRPEPSFLKDLLPYFQEENVGLVQARWGHLNKSQNLLTRIQSFLLDTYFTIEQTGRYKSGMLTNFCGTAGIWRKQSIVEAGGWDGRVLSEDLDISYRMQLKGWKIVYDDDTVAPAELPPVMEAFKLQQARWTKGMAQACKKNFGDVLRSGLPFSKKLHAFFHLSTSFVFPCLLFSSLLCFPLLLLRHAYPEFVTLTRYTTISNISFVLLTLIFYVGTKGNKKETQFFVYFPVFSLVFLALSVQNTVAVLQGLFGKSSTFVRTPKFATQNANSTVYIPKKTNAVHTLELILAGLYASGIVLSFYLQDFFYLPLFAIMFCGLTMLAAKAPFKRKFIFRQAIPKISWR